MTFWGKTQFRMVPAVDRDSAIYRQDADPLDAADIFGEFLNFDGDEAPDTPFDSDRNGNPDSFFMNPAAMLTESSVQSSPEDESEYFAASSQLGNVSSTASHGASQENDGTDIAELAFGEVSDPATGVTAHQLGYHGNLDRESMSDNNLHRLEDISLRSPQTTVSSVPHTSSPAPTTTAGRPKKVFEAISSTLRKATNTLGRRGRREQQQERQQLSVQQHSSGQRAASPTLEHPPMAIHPRPQRMHSVTQTNMGSLSHESPSSQGFDPNSSAFATGFSNDPFSDQPRAYPSPNANYFNDGGMGPTAVHGFTRRIKSEQQLYQGSPSMLASTATIDTASQMPQQQQHGGWQHPLTTSTAPEPWDGQEYVTSQEPRWWEFSMNASVNQAMHSQHGELPYEYGPLPDSSAAGLMIHMPQHHPSPPGAINDIALTAQTYFPPPPPIPGSERGSRPPRAPSSGTRHRNMSSSPMRRTRGPSASASPTQVHSQMRNQSRHSSTGSISSVRSNPGRGPGSAPNTPGGVRKRRSRDVLGANLGGGISLGGGGGGGGEGLGFVNFTPNDGNVLMTGVAPSGSSKTKARREKEAQEKRRKLSEAAMKAVAAAGGDVDKLIQEGFVF